MDCVSNCIKKLNIVRSNREELFLLMSKCSPLTLQPTPVCCEEKHTVTTASERCLVRLCMDQLPYCTVYINAHAHTHTLDQSQLDWRIIVSGVLKTEEAVLLRLERRLQDMQATWLLICLPNSHTFNETVSHVLQRSQQHCKARPFSMKSDEERQIKEKN